LLLILCTCLNPAFQKTLRFESLRLGAVNRAKEVIETASGKGVNVARVLTQLGRHALGIGFVGGETGEFIKAQLRQQGIPFEFVTTRSKTRTCITLLEAAQGLVTELVEEGREVLPDEVQALKRLFTEKLAGVSLVSISGTAPKGVPEDLYRDWTRMAAERGIPVIIDAPGRLLLNCLGARPLLAKPNRAELAAALGRDLSSMDALKQAMAWVLRMGAEWVAVSMGAEGVVLSRGEEYLRFRPPAIRAVNPIGSGDAMTAGIAAKLVDGEEMAEAVRFGVACGAANALTPTSGVVRSEEIGNLIAQVVVEYY